MSIPNDYQIKKEEKKEYPLLPKNVYQAELLDITLKDATGKYAKPGDKNFVFQFTLLAGKDKNEDLRGRNVWDNFVKTTIYLGKNGKNNLWEIVEAFLNRELTLQEQAEGLTGEFINSFIGKQIKLFIDQLASAKDGKTYNVITSYIPIETELARLTDEEKDKATVKKEAKPSRDEYEGDRTANDYDQDRSQPDPEDIAIQDIPF